MTKQTQNLSVRLPREKKQKLEKIAAIMDRTRNWVIADAIDQYLDVYEWQTKYIKEQLRLVKSGKAKLIPNEEVMADLKAHLDSWEQ